MGPAVSLALEKGRQRHSPREVEPSLSEGERKFRTLFDAAHDSIYMLHNGIFVDCNAKGLYMYGRTWIRSSATPRMNSPR